ncbi:hypothetical protein ACRAVF_04440 [Bradyrhizobium oligotrophicum S58]
MNATIDRVMTAGFVELRFPDLDRAAAMRCRFRRPDERGHAPRSAHITRTNTRHRALVDRQFQTCRLKKSERRHDTAKRWGVRSRRQFRLTEADAAPPGSSQLSTPGREMP